MTSVEMMAGVLGDAYINGALAQGVGFDGCTVRDVSVSGGKIAFGLETAKTPRDLVIRFTGLNPDSICTLVVNGRNAGSSGGRKLLNQGYSLRL
jgi:hypothetical protein